MEFHIQEDTSRAALNELGMDMSIDHVTDFMQIYVRFGPGGRW